MEMVIFGNTCGKLFGPRPKMFNLNFIFATIKYHMIFQVKMADFKTQPH